MNQNNKLQVRDLIILGVLNAVFMVIMLIFAMVLGIIPLASIFVPAAAAIPLGVVFMLLMVKVAKTGTLLLSGILQGTVSLFMGISWPLITAIVISALLGELVIRGAYKNLKRIAISYAVLIGGYAVGSFAPLVFFADAYRAMATSRGYDEVYINKIIELLNGPVFAGILAVSIAGALLGALLGKRLLRKHFSKAGIV